MTEYRLEIRDYKNNHLCTLYDSNVTSEGQAFDIEISKELNGWKQVSFSLPNRLNDGSENFRLDFIKNEYLLYVYDSSESDPYDVYTIKQPKLTHDNKHLNVSVSCNHICEELKTKNLYRYFTDENGIDTCQGLISKALGGSGWTLTNYTRFYEADGVTEKIRSYSCDTKTGAYAMLADICELFQARPVFHGHNRTVEIFANTDTVGVMEINYGKNLSKISRKLDSTNLATRLYVEGQYGDLGYVGIEDVNPTGLSFLLDFSYYKEIGVFGDTEQALVDRYILDSSNLVSLIKTKQTQFLETNSSLIEKIGTCGYALHPISNGTIDMDTVYSGGTYEDGDLDFKTGDKIMLATSSGEFQYKYVEYAPNTQYSGYGWCVKFIPTIVGTVAGHEDIISSMNDGIDDLLENLNKYHRKKEYPEVASVQALKTAYNVTDLRDVKKDTYDPSSLPEQYKNITTRTYAANIGEAEATIKSNQLMAEDEMSDAIGYMQQCSQLSDAIKAAQNQQTLVDDGFANSMGFMLRDAYWSDDKYAPGQEATLYADACDIMTEISKPLVSYDISVLDLSVLDEHKGEEFKVGQYVRVYDHDLNINDFAYVSKTRVFPDKPNKNAIEMKTDIREIGQKSFSSILDRVTSLAEDVRNNRDIYKRANIISSDGSLNSSFLNGGLDVSTNWLSAVASNWSTDGNGNFIFVSNDGTNAMKLCGSGYMVANSKNPDGSWKWRLFGSGSGFSMDQFTSGTVNPDLIAEGTLPVNRLIAGEVTTFTLNAVTARIEELIAHDIKTDDLYAGIATIGQANIDSAYIESLMSGTIDTNTLVARVANIAQAKIESLTADDATVTTLKANFARIATAAITIEYVSQLMAQHVETNELVARVADIARAKIEELTASSATINDLKTNIANIAKANIDAAYVNSLLAGTIQTNVLKASIAQIADAQIAEAEIDSAQIVDLEATTANIFDAKIGDARIGYAQIDDLNANQLIAHDAVTDRYFIDKLQVVNAQMVNATVGNLIVKASDNKYYRLDIGADGSLTPVNVTSKLTNEEIAAGVTADGRGSIIETNLTAQELSASNMKAINALIDKITASRIDVDQLFAREATIAQLNTANISGNESVKITVRDGVKEAVDNILIGGRNLIVNTLDAVVAPAASRPRILGQTTNTATQGGWSWSTAEHGFRVTDVDGTNRLWVAFGWADFSALTMNGLTAGRTYTLSFDYEAKILSNISSTSHNLQAVVFYAYTGDGSNRNLPEMRFQAVTPGQVVSGKAVYTFTVPANAVKCYFKVDCTDQTGADYAVDDYLELSNLKLEEGNKATAWTPAPEDYPVKMEDIAKEQVDTLFEVGDGRIVGKVTTSTEWSNQSQNIQTAQATATSANTAAGKAQTDATKALGDAADAAAAASAANTAAGNAATAASAAQTTANQKRRVFTSQPWTPYEVGDMWAEGSTGDLKVCVKARASGSYTASEWQLASKYTDDTKAEKALNDLADAISDWDDEFDTLKSQVDGKAEIWFGSVTPTASNAPASSWNTAALKSDHVGDIYYNTANGYCYRYTSSYAWERIKDNDIVEAAGAAATAKSVADGKAQVFVSQPKPPYYEGDLWVQGANGDILRCTKDRTSGSYLASEWVLASKYTDDTAVNNLQIGGRNLLAYCRFTTDVSSQITIENLWMKVNLARNEYVYPWGLGSGALVMFPAGTYTFSVEDGDGFFTNGRVELAIYNQSTGTKFTSYVFSETGSETIVVKDGYYIGYISFYGYTGAVSNKLVRMKLERGDKATDWTPAPEDVAASIDEVAGALTELSTNVTTNYAKKTEVTNATTQDAIWQKVSTKEEYQQQVTITEELNAIVKANDNLFVNLFEQDFAKPSGYPRLIGQTVDTATNTCTATVAQHGMRVTAIDAHRPLIRFGHYSATASGASMNGLSAGNYTLSFDYEAKMFSGSPTGTVYLGAYVFQSADGENFYQTHSKTLETYTSGHYTEKRTGSCAFAFTVNASTVKLYLIIAPNVSTNAFHAAGDYLEATDLKLEEGNKKTPFKLNAQDSVRALEKRVSTNESSITELDDEIALRVTEEGVFEALRDHNYASRNLLKDANAPTLTAVYANMGRESTSTAGDRYFSTNDAVTTTYATFTDCPCGAVYGFTAVSSGGGSNGAGLVFYRNYAEPVLNIGSTYTMSCFVRVRAGSTASVRFVIGTGTYSTHTFTLAGAEHRAWSRVSWTFTATADVCTKSGSDYYTRVDYQLLAANAATVDFCGFQLEEGEVATDWTPNIGEYTHMLDSRVKGAELKLEPDKITAAVMGQETSSLEGKTLEGYLTQLNTALGEANFTISRAGIVQKVMEQSQTSLGMSLKSYLDNLEGDVDDVSGDLTSLTSRVSTTESAVKPGAIMNTVMTTETTDLAGKSLLTYLNTLKVGGRNLFINTLNMGDSGDSVAAADRPKLAGQTSNTALMTGWSLSSALHGFCYTNTSGANRLWVAFGYSSDFSAITMNGLKAGETYTISFDYEAKVLSNISSGTYYLRTSCLYAKSGDLSITGNTDKTFQTIGSGQYGQKVTGRCDVTFTIPSTAVKCYLKTDCTDETGSHYATGDYIKITNLKLEEGDRATDWTPAPEDIVTLQGEYNVTKKAVLNLTDENITAAVTREMSTTLGGKDLETYLGDLYTDTTDAMALAEDKRRVFLTQPTGPYDYQDLWVGGSTGDLKICTNTNGRKTGYNASDWALATKYTDYRLFRGTANPTPPYRVGDMWANGTDLRVCKTAKATGESYLAADWEKATAYTDDTTANTALITAKGGRNLLLGTGTGKATSTYSSADSSYTGQYYLSEYGNSVANHNTTDVFTVSFDISVTGNSSATAYVYPQFNSTAIVPVSGSSRDLVFGTATTGHHECSFKLNSTQATTNIGSSRMRFRLREATDGTVLTVLNVKLEKGTEATAWDVAPEDLSSLEDTVNNDILGSGENSIATRLSNAEVQIEPGNITSTVLDQVTNKLSDESGNSTSLINKLSSIEQTADGIKSTVESHDERIKNLNTSARNLFINTLTPSVAKAADYPRLAGQTANTVTQAGWTWSTAEHGFRVTNSSGVNRLWIGFGYAAFSSLTMNGLVAGETYSLSFDYAVKILSNVSSGTCNLQATVFYARTGDGSNINLPIKVIQTITPGQSVSGRFTYTFTIPATAIKCYIRIDSSDSTGSHFAIGDYLELSNLMLVHANTPAKWEPAPEDLQKYTETQVADAKSEIKQTTDSITMSVRGMAIKNLFMNTVSPVLDPAVLRPMLVGQTASTYVYGGSAVSVTHGIGARATSATYPGIRFGSNSATEGTMNGLEVGKTYTWSFDYTLKLFSGSPSGAQNVRAYLYWVASGASTFSTDADHYTSFNTYATTEYGSVKNGHLDFKFTVPTGATKIYMIVRPQNTTASYFASGDYIHLKNLLLVEGDNTGEDKIEYDTWIDSASESIIEQKADSIRLKAGTIAWEADNSSMDEEGNLIAATAVFTDAQIECVAPNNQGGLYIGKYGDIAIGTSKPPTLWEFDNACQFQVTHFGDAKTRLLYFYNNGVLFGRLSSLALANENTGVWIAGPTGNRCVLFSDSGSKFWTGVEIATTCTINGNLTLPTSTLTLTSGSANIGGTLTVSGTKNRRVSTDDFGDVLLSAYETPSPMFGDVGEGTVGTDGLCYIDIDPVFAETINTNSYQVFLQKYGEGDVYVKERHPGYFVVKGTAGLSFGWEVKGKQADFDQLRLEKPTEDFMEQDHDYGTEGADYIEQIQEERIQ